MGIFRSGSLICEVESSRAQAPIPPDKKLSAASAGLSLWGSLRDHRTDPRQIELEDADWRALFEQLRRIYSRLANMVLGSIAAFILGAIVFVPRVGWPAGLVLSGGVMSVSWMILDRVRRI